MMRSNETNPFLNPVFERAPMNRNMLIALLAVASLVSCTTPPSVTHTKLVETRETVAQRQFLIGTWKGEAPVTGGGFRTWVVVRNPNGTYRIDFTHEGVPNMPDVQSEVGIWGVSGGIYFTATRGFVDSGGAYPADTNDASLYDTYRIISLGSDVFEYESLATGNRFSVRKVHSPSSVVP